METNKYLRVAMRAKSISDLGNSDDGQKPGKQINVLNI